MKGNSKITWVSLVDACKPKSKGGLEVSDLSLVHLALLAKWRWCLILGAFVFGDISLFPVMVPLLSILEEVTWI